MLVSLAGRVAGWLGARGKDRRPCPERDGRLPRLFCLCPRNCSQSRAATLVREARGSFRSISIPFITDSFRVILSLTYCGMGDEAASWCLFPRHCSRSGAVSLVRGATRSFHIVYQSRFPPASPWGRSELYHLVLPLSFFHFHLISSL